MGRRKKSRTWHLPGLLHIAAVALILMLICQVMLHFSNDWNTRANLITLMNLTRNSAIILAGLHLNLLTAQHARNHASTGLQAAFTALVSGLLILTLFSHHPAAVRLLALGTAVVSYSVQSVNARHYRRQHAYNLSGLATYEHER